jgi:hypothetical protein
MWYEHLLHLLHLSESPSTVMELPDLQIQHTDITSMDQAPRGGPSSSPRREGAGPPSTLIMDDHYTRTWEHFSKIRASIHTCASSGNAHSFKHVQWWFSSKFMTLVNEVRNKLM